MNFTIDEVGAANLFIAMRGRSGESQQEDRDCLVRLLRVFAFQGVKAGLAKAKDLFRDSTDARGGCKMVSSGEKCRCFLCLADNEIAGSNDL